MKHNYVHNVAIHLREQHWPTYKWNSVGRRWHRLGDKL